MFFSAASPTTTGTNASLGFNITGGDFLAASTTGSATRTVDSTGWVPVNFAKISAGSPIGQLPLDPINSTSTFDPFGDALIYGYAATTTNFGFKFVSHMESSKYRSGGTNDLESTDGGVGSTTYEQGTLLSL